MRDGSRNRSGNYMRIARDARVTAASHARYGRWHLRRGNDPKAVAPRAVLDEPIELRNTGGDELVCRLHASTR